MRYLIAGILAFGIIYVAAKDMSSVYEKANRGIAYDRCVGIETRAYRIEEGLSAREQTDEELIADPFVDIPEGDRKEIAETCAKEAGIQVR